jgi:hypothetical protein
MAARRAGKAGMQALQIYRAIPKFYNDKVGVKPDRVARFHEALAEAGIEARHVIVHAAYVLNCATPDEEKWSRAAAGLAKEFERSTALGVGGVCFHPGAATSGDRHEACARVAEAMRRALAAVPESHTRLLIENTAGAGTTVGRTPDEVALMLSGIPNLALVFGYTNASWTLRADLVNAYVGRLLQHLRQTNTAWVMPKPPGQTVPTAPWVDFSSGYFQRALDRFPKQGEIAPWRTEQNYKRDVELLKKAPLEDGVLEFGRP